MREDSGLNAAFGAAAVAGVGQGRRTVEAK